MTPIQILSEVLSIGGRLEPTGDKLRMLLPADCPPELKDAIRANKPALLRLLTRNFLLVRSDALKMAVLWVPDTATKDALVDAGADRGCIYTARELEQLVHRRITVAELPVIHAAKARFSGTITDPDRRERDRRQ